MVQAMDIFIIYTYQDVTKPRENCNLKLAIVDVLSVKRFKLGLFVICTEHATMDPLKMVH